MRIQIFGCSLKAAVGAPRCTWCSLALATPPRSLTTPPPFILRSVCSPIEALTGRERMRDREISYCLRPFLPPQGGTYSGCEPALHPACFWKALSSCPHPDGALPISGGGNDTRTHTVQPWGCVCGDTRAMSEGLMPTWEHIMCPGWVTSAWYSINAQALLHTFPRMAC